MAWSHRKNSEGGAEVRERDGHRPGTADRPRHDLVGARRLEWITYRDRVRIDLEPPDSRPDLVEEVDAGPFIRYRGRRPVTGDALQCRRGGRLRAGRARVEQCGTCDQLTQIAVGRDVEIAEPSVLRIRSVRLQPRQAAHRLGGDDRTHRLARRVDQVQVVRLPTEVP